MARDLHITPQLMNQRNHKASVWRKALITLLVSGASTLAAQDALDTLNPLSSTPGGVRLENLSVFASYATGAIDSPLSSGANMGSNIPVGATATLGYLKTGERTDLSITYAPSYTRIIGYSGLDTSTHALAVNLRRSLSPRWIYSSFITGNLSILNESLVSTPAPPVQQAATGQLIGSANPSLGDLTPVTLFYGQRFLTTSIQNSLAYTYSPRLTFHVGLSGIHLQSLPDGAMTTNMRYGALISRTTTGTGSLGVAYSVSPRTQVGFDAGTSRTFSTYQDAYVTTFNGSVGHSAGRHWSMQVQGGTGLISPLRQTFATQGRGLQYQAGGNIGYKTYAHTFTMSAVRSASDAYGLGSSATLSSTATWTYSRPGTSWWLTSSFQEQWMTGSVYGGLDTKHISVDFGRMLGKQVAAVLQYAYGTYSGAAAGPLGHLDQQVVRLSFSWVPGAGLRR